MKWALESSQPMVMLLLDFEKEYDRVEWSFFEGTMAKMGFNEQWIKWIRVLHVDSWCTVGINITQSQPFPLTRSIRQGCPIAPFLYLFISDNLGYLLKKQGVKGLNLQESDSSVTDQKFADDTILYLEGTVENLNRTKVALELFALELGSKINWYKSHAIWVNQTSKSFDWGLKVQLHWLALKETIRYLDFP